MPFIIKFNLLLNLAVFVANSLRGQLEIPNIPNDNSANDTAKSILETRNDREAALRKLMDRNSVYNPDKVRDLNIGSKNEPVSLASFVGGRATAPRLNRHAPQADANDSTQYIQPDLTAPHPVFGTGGVAIPGMTSKRESKSPIPFVGSEQSERYRPSSANTKSSPSPIPVPGVGKAAEPSKRMNTDINRRSFTAIHKSPSPALAQRYTEKLDDSATRDAKLGPDLAKRKSISKSSSLLSSPTTEENSLTPIGMSPSKSADDYRSISATSSSWKSSPVVSSSLSSSKGERPAPSILASATKMKPTTSIGSSTLSYGGTSVLTSSSSSKPIKTHSYPTTPSSDHRSLLSYDSPSYAVSTAKKDDTPLRRLMERNHVHNPDKGAAENSRKSVVERAQTTSLAAFMGGSGKGIRLNKHAPQVDAHDPTQFVQPDLNTPHPVFGKGGVAMPGMITRKSAPDARSRADNADLSTPASTKKAIWPPIYSAEKTEERPVSPQKSGGRARTNSVPRLESSVGFGGSQANSWRSHATERLQSPTKETRDTPFRDRTISTPSTAQHSVVTPSLARPLQPTSKAFSLSPQVPVITASPAFKNPISQKDLTPSLSRLQGRGFVQNMVKASSHISNTPPSPTPPPTRPTSATGKKGLVSDRWQQNVQPNSPTKSLTTPSALKGSSSTSNLEASHSLKSTASLPSFGKLAVSTPSPQPAESRAHLDPYQRSHTPGLGSATTMVVIKPSKSFTDLSEMGMKNGHGDIAQFSNLDSTPSRKPPIHVR